MALRLQSRWRLLRLYLSPRPRDLYMSGAWLTKHGYRRKRKPQPWGRRLKALAKKLKGAAVRMLQEEL